MRFAPTLLSSLDARDRALLQQCVHRAAVSRRSRRVWTALTHTGGASATITLSVLPLFAGDGFAVAARASLLTLVLSHLLVQLVKRRVGRPRPSRQEACQALVTEPDRFSFPSGHAAAAMSVALAYSFAFPALAAPLLVLAMLVGLSRAFLGVHYPGDVVIGQAIAALTFAALRAAGVLG